MNLFNITGQEITKSEDFNPVISAIKEDTELQFSFLEGWDNIDTFTAQFTQGEKLSARQDISVYINEENAILGNCKIPFELTSGEVSLSVVGYKNHIAKLITTDVCVFEIEKTDALDLGELANSIQTLWVQQSELLNSAQKDVEDLTAQSNLSAKKAEKFSALSAEKAR
ncbi:MAG: hypothetical protein RR253_08045, partial [Oscillospiraceae bacterium]